MSIVSKNQAGKQEFSPSDRLELLNAALQRLDGNEFKVYCRLVQIADNRRQSFESTKDRQTSCNIRSRTTLIAIDKSLEAQGMVRRLGSKHQGYTFQLTVIEEWDDRDRGCPKSEHQPENNRPKSILGKAKAMADRVSSSVVQKLNKSNSQQRDSSPPVRGLESRSAVPEMSKNCTDAAKEKTVAPGNSRDTEVLSKSCTENLGDKLEAARKRGWWDSGVWWNDLGEQMVTVNSFVVRAAEFMARSLDSFDSAINTCAEGLARCRAKIEEIKRRRQYG